MPSHSNYLKSALFPALRADAVLRCLVACDSLPYKPEVVVSTGLSGVLVAVDLAKELRCDLCVVRKGEDSHGFGIEFTGSNGFPEHWVVVDDFIGSGGTVARIFRTLIDAVPELMEPMAVLQYDKEAYEQGPTFRPWRDVDYSHGENFPSTPCYALLTNEARATFPF